MLVRTGGRTSLFPSYQLLHRKSWQQNKKGSAWRCTFHSLSGPPTRLKVEMFRCCASYNYIRILSSTHFTSKVLFCLAFRALLPQLLLVESCSLADPCPGQPDVEPFRCFLSRIFWFQLNFWHFSFILPSKVDKVHTSWRRKSQEGRFKDTSPC